MAEIKATTSEKVFSLTKFLGLNQAPDGDTKLKMGEATEMFNFRVTRDGNLQRRPGTRTVVNTGTGKPIKGLWVGFVNGHEYMLGGSNGKMYKLWDETNGFVKVQLGDVSTTGDVHIFGFNSICYILDGAKYRQWDGTTYQEVAGYVPIVYINVPPVNGDDQSSTYENVNRLNLKRRIWISPDGVGDTFELPEKNNASVDYVKDLTTGENVSAEDYSVNASNDEVTFDSVPTQHVNSYEIGYTASIGLEDEDPRDLVESMRYSELYAGTQDTRAFLYGNGSNKCIYSGIDYNGNPRADYFPDLYECAVGDENTPITGMIRHYSRLICFKSNSTWTINATQMTLADNLSVPAFYVQPVNRTIGNAAMGQVELVLNSPFTLFGDDLYEWKNRAAYGSNLTSDERQAVRISDRIWYTLSRFDAKSCYCYDDNDNQEYYICYNNQALVYNYVSDAWTKYEDFPVACLVNLHGELYIGTPDGKLKHFNYAYLSDDGKRIKAYWESGSMSFGQDYMKKYAAMIWVGIKPERRGELYVTVKTDKKDTYGEKVVSSIFDLLSFADINFADFCFGANTRPFMKRLKIKAKKFIFYKLVFECDSASATATVLAADIRVRFTGYAK